MIGSITGFLLIFFQRYSLKSSLIIFLILLQSVIFLSRHFSTESDTIALASSGDVLELNDEHAQVVDHVQTGAIFVDGLGVGDVGNIVLRDRQNLAENGIIIVVLTLEKYTGQLIAGPDIVTRGFVYVREAEELLDEARAIVSYSVEKCPDSSCRHIPY